jgi:hypothetical protein
MASSAFGKLPNAARWEPAFPRRNTRLVILVIRFVPDLIIACAKGSSRLLAGFRDEFRFCHWDQARYFALIGLAGKWS